MTVWKRFEKGEEGIWERKEILPKDVGDWSCKAKEERRKWEGGEKGGARERNKEGPRAAENKALGCKQLIQQMYPLYHSRTVPAWLSFSILLLCFLYLFCLKTRKGRKIREGEEVCDMGSGFFVPLHVSGRGCWTRRVLRLRVTLAHN